MSLYTIKGTLLDSKDLGYWENLFTSLSKLLNPIIDKGEKDLLIFHYSNEEKLPVGNLSWTTNFSLDRDNIHDSTGLVPYEGYKYVYVALVTIEDESTQISFSQNLTRIGGYEIELLVDDSKRGYVAKLPITVS